MQILNININDITISKRLLSSTSIEVKNMKTSIIVSGLLTPIIVDEKYKLLSGNVRLKAFKDLNKKTIPCLIQNVSDLEKELIEVEENIVRRHLTSFQTMILYSKQKELYEKLHLTSTKSFKSANNSLPKEERVETEKSFASDLSEKIGCSTKSITDKISQHAKINENEKLLEVMTQLDKNCEIKGIELKKISQLSPEDMDDLTNQIQNSLKLKKTSLSDLLKKEETSKPSQNKLNQVFMYDLLSVIKNTNFTHLEEKIKINIVDAKNTKSQTQADFTKEIKFILENLA